jgi:hypothetical protein
MAFGVLQCSDKIDLFFCTLRVSYEHDLRIALNFSKREADLVIELVVTVLLDTRNPPLLVVHEAQAWILLQKLREVEHDRLKFEKCLSFLIKINRRIETNIKECPGWIRIRN